MAQPAAEALGNHRTGVFVVWWLLLILLLLLPLAFVNSPSCECCPSMISCTGCATDPSNTYQIVLAGFGNNDCTSCTLLNATHVLTYDPAYSGSGTCAFTSATIDMGAGAGCDIQIGLFFQTTGIIDVDIFPAGGGTRYYRFEKTYSGAGTIPCASLSSESIPLTEGSPPTYCTTGGATCNVTTL